MMGSLVFAEPAARQVQSCNDQEPCDVYTKQVHAEFGGMKSKCLTGSNYILYGITLDKKEDDIKCPDQVKMEYIVEKRHITVNY